VPNDSTAVVLISDGSNAGKTLETARYGSGVAIVQPILFPEVKTMRLKVKLTIACSID
jgi:hypothetical protein